MRVCRTLHTACFWRDAEKKTVRTEAEITFQTKQVFPCRTPFFFVCFMKAQWRKLQIAHFELVKISRALFLALLRRQKEVERITRNYPITK
jgi:hypothetical protein